MRRFFLALGAIFLGSTLAHADLIVTSNGSFIAQDPGLPGPSSGPPLNGVAILDTSSGFGFANQVEGGSPAVGNTVYSASFADLSAASGIPVGINAPQYNPFTLANGNVAGLVTVLEGQVVSAGGTLQTVGFLRGSVYVVDAGPLGVGNALATGSLNPAAVVARYDLFEQSPIVSGFPLGEGSAFGEIRGTIPTTNLSSINTALQIIGDSALIFGETSIGANFLSNVQDLTPALIAAGLVPPGSVFGEEVLISRPQLTLSTANGNTALTDGILATINLFAQDALGVNFANSVAEFNPQFSGGASLTGDFFFSGITGKVNVGHTVVPEPSSLLCFAGLLGSGMFMVRRRRK
jgi:hypothetical protein